MNVGITESVEVPRQDVQDPDFVLVIENGRMILRIDNENNVTFGDGLSPEQATLRAFQILYDGISK